MEEKLALEENNQECEKEQQERKRREEIGGVLLGAIAFVNVILSFIVFFSGGSFFSLFVQIGLSIGLVLGVRWIRYLFAVGLAGASIFLLFYLVESFNDSGSSPEGARIIMLIIGLILTISATIFLFKSKYISAYIDHRKRV